MNSKRNAPKTIIRKILFQIKATKLDCPFLSAKLNFENFCDKPPGDSEDSNEHRALRVLFSGSN